MVYNWYNSCLELEYLVITSDQNLAKLTRNGVYLTIVRDVYELEVVFASYNYV